MNKRGDSLLEAHQIINGERQDQYGNPEDSFSFIGRYWTIYLSQKYPDVKLHILSDDVAMMMSLMKIARIGNGVGSRDSSVDAEAYIALAEDILSKRRNLPTGESNE